MTRILRLDCSITDSQSISRRLSDYFVDQWRETDSAIQVEIRDLVTNPLPHFNFNNLLGMVSPREMQTDPVRAASALSEELIAQVETSNVLLIGCPMYNFTIPSQLKAWLDHVTIAGRTFRYIAPNVAQGLLKGIEVFIIAARGGDYSSQQSSSWDFQEPLLRHWLTFLGFTSVHFIRAEGLKLDPERAPGIVKEAEEQIRRLVGSALNGVVAKESTS